MALAQLSDIRTAIKTALDGITGLTNYKEEPDAVKGPPFTVLGNAEIDYSSDMGGGQNFRFKLFLAVADAESQTSFSTLDDYLASSGTKSIAAAINAGTIGNGFAMVTRAENVGKVRYRERTYAGAEIIIVAQSGG